MSVVVPLKPPRSVLPTVVPRRGKNCEYRQREYLTEAEVEKLLAAARKTKNPIRDQLIVLLCFRHALRVSELVDLRVDQFDLKAASMHVNRRKNGLSGIHGLAGDEMRLDAGADARERRAQPVSFPQSARRTPVDRRRAEASRATWRGCRVAVSGSCPHAATCGRICPGWPRCGHADISWGIARSATPWCTPPWPIGE